MLTLQWLSPCGLTKPQMLSTIFKMSIILSFNTHTIVLLLFWILSGTTQVSSYQKGKTNLDLLKQEIVSGSGICWAIWGLLHNTQPFYGSVEFVLENPGEPVPEETFTHYSHRSHQSSLSAFSI